MKRFLKKVTGILLCAAMVAATAMFVVSAQEDISADPMTFAVNNTTVNSGYTVAAGDAYNYCMVLRTGRYFEYTVHTETAARYRLTVRTGTISAGEKMSVSVNGVSQIENAVLDNTNAYSTRNPNEIGCISLADGENVIRFSSPAGTSGILMVSFTLTKTRASYTVPVTKADDVDSWNIGASADTPIGWYPTDISACMIMRGNGNGNSWVAKNITVSEAGWYGVTVNLGAGSQYETGLTLKATAGGRSTSRTVAVTGGYTDYQDRYIGKLYLEAGPQTVWLEVTKKAAFVRSFTLGDLQSDFADDALEYDISPTAVSSTSGYTEADWSTGDASYNWCMNLRGTKTFTVSVYAEEALCYNLTARYGTNKTGETLDVSVNGYKQIEAAPTENTGNYACTSGHQVGVLQLNRGINDITFALGAGSTNAIVMDSVSLALADSFRNGEFKAWVQENRIPNYYFVSEAYSGFDTVGGSECATVRPSSWVEYDVYTAEERQVNMLLDMASPETIAFSVSVNGVSQIVNENIGQPSESYAAYATVTSAGMLTIPAGHSVIRYTEVTGAGNLRSLGFQEVNLNEAVITNFEIQNEDGGRMPYAVRSGLNGYAAVTVKKLGEADDTMRLIIAEYADDSSLVNVSESIVDVSQMANRETKEFKTELALKEGGVCVKAFLMRQDTFEPLSEARSYKETPIFSEDVLEASVSYESATNVLNNDGENYAEYGLHDGTYDIDAIFYTGHGNTKVFAYIGFPKNASADNKVPAMVLVHGGIGKAEISWVKKWNDLGYAAIAMDLYGCGPEDDSASYSGSGKKKHPYAGVAPWDFSEDFENAGMYQSVINVINAHTLIRNDSRVDASKIGITGISWGGITTTTVCGVDNRFMFAVPVYGCGYLDQCKTYFGSRFDSAGQSVAWDPANFAAKAEMPVLFVNSDADAHFSINSSSLTYGVVENGYLSIHHGLTHSQQAGDSIQQVYDFADNMFKGNDPYIKINGADAENGVLTADCSVPSGTSVQGVTMYYLTDKELPSGGGSNIGWTAVTDYSENDGTITVNIPQNATYVYASVTDNNGNIMSTKFLKVK